jgi:NAD(P)-dependent dehydrogenase (short-subunit alcohol dehydrogenase family)
MATSTQERPEAAATVGEKLKGRVAFVTGGNRAIGAAICRSLATHGRKWRSATRGIASARSSCSAS